MNEYTRREEITWTLVTVIVLVLCVAAAIFRLVSARGPMVTDPSAIAAEDKAQEAVDAFKNCPAPASKLATEVGLFKGRADEAKTLAEKEASKKLGRYRRYQKPKPVEFELPWSAAHPVFKQAAALGSGNCMKAAYASVGLDKAAAPVWNAISSASALEHPKDDKKKQQDVAKKLLELFKDLPLDKVVAHTQRAQASLAKKLTKASKRRSEEKIRAPLPQGLFPRSAAIGVGVGVALAALIISYISVRSASLRRAKTLVTLRRFANTPEAGLQAAALVRLAAHHNGGEPGMVTGAAIGGLLAAFTATSDDPNSFMPDLYVAGSMGGLLLGLASQWLVRTLLNTAKWRQRTMELAEVEKPTIPVQLVLRAVTRGLEKQFLRYFEALSIADASIVVQKLAAQAEEQILAAADAAHSHDQAAYGQQQWPPGAQAPPGAGPPNAGMPPGM